jgi:hypothetical protein
VRIVLGFLRAGAVAGVFVDGGTAVAGIDDCAGAEAPLGSGGLAAVGAGAAGLEAGAAIALTALRQGGDNLGSLRKRHSRASLPPGWTLAQLAMKSERQAARTASRCACVGCCAAAGASVSATRQPAASEDLNIETLPGIFRHFKNACHCTGRPAGKGFSCRSLSLPAMLVLLVEVDVGWRLGPMRQRVCLWLRATSSD